jgi:hypothetical protein
VGHAAYMWEIRTAFKMLIGKPERKTQLRIPRFRSKDNTKLGLKNMHVLVG